MISLDELNLDEAFVGWLRSCLEGLAEAELFTRSENLAISGLLGVQVSDETVGVGQWIGIAESSRTPLGEHNWQGCLGVYHRNPDVESSLVIESGEPRWVNDPASPAVARLRHRSVIQLQILAASLKRLLYPTTEAQSLSVVFANSGSMAQIENAIRSTEARPLDAGSLLFALDVRLQLATQTQDVSQLNRCVGVLTERIRQPVEAIDLHSAELDPHLIVALADTLAQRFGMTRNSADSSQAISLYREVLTTSILSEVQSTHAKCRLSQILGVVAETISVPTEALELLWEAQGQLRSIPDGSLEIEPAVIASNISLALHEYLPDHDLEASRCELELLLDAPTTTEEGKRRLQSQLAIVLGVIIESASGIDFSHLIDRQIELSRSSLDSTVFSSERCRRASNLAIALLDRHASEGVQADLDEAVELLDEAALLVLPDDEKSRINRNRAVAARRKAAVAKACGKVPEALGLLAEAQELFQNAGGFESSSFDGATLLGDLATLHFDRFVLVGKRSEIDTAIELAKAALESLEEAGARFETTRIKMQLGEYFLEAYGRFGGVDHLNSAQTLLGNLKSSSWLETASRSIVGSFGRIDARLQGALANSPLQPNWTELSIAVGNHGDSFVVKAASRCAATEQALFGENRAPNVQDRIDGALTGYLYETKQLIENVRGRKLEISVLSLATTELLNIFEQDNGTKPEAFAEPMSQLINRLSELVLEPFDEKRKTKARSLLALLLFSNASAVGSISEMRKAFTISSQLISDSGAELGVKQEAARIAAVASEYLNEDSAHFYSVGLELAAQSRLLQGRGLSLQSSLNIAIESGVGGFVGGAAAFRVDPKEACWLLDREMAPLLRRGLGKGASTLKEFVKRAEEISETIAIAFVAQSLTGSRVVTVSKRVWTDSDFLPGLGSHALGPLLRAMFQKKTAPSEGEASELRAALETAIGDRLPKDIPVAVFPSGLWSFVPISAWLTRNRAVAYPVALVASVGRPGRDLGLGAKSRVLAVGVARAPGFDPILLAEEDAVEVAGFFQCGKSLLGTAANSGTILNEMASSDATLLGCHGLSDVRNWQESKLFVGQDSDGDSELNTSQLLNVDLSSNAVVVLAACEVGRPAQEVPDSNFGLHSAFLNAGAGSVVASHFEEVNVVASAFVRSFFENLKIEPILLAYSFALHSVPESSATGFGLTFASAASMKLLTQVSPGHV